MMKTFEIMREFTAWEHFLEAEVDNHMTKDAMLDLGVQVMTYLNEYPDIPHYVIWGRPIIIRRVPSENGICALYSVTVKGLHE